ncbi:MAG: MoxR family ATPase [Desulfobacterales bacterium]|nr:MoxR family ATPase [Desulfobacterales bacterium]
MARLINLELYEGDGVPISQRDQVLPEYEPLDLEHPKNYIADKGLREAVNVALALGQPLLVTGEPGTGKTQLAASIAYELELPLLEFYTKTTSAAVDLFYQYDALRRFQDSHTPGREINVEDYITYQALGIAILLSQPPDKVKSLVPAEFQGTARPVRSVVLIDEIDKAPRDFSNDLLNEVEKMRFTVRETGNTFVAEQRFRPILILTSNSEKNLPDAFLRRCIFYHIPFPSEERLIEIVKRRFGKREDITPEFIKGLINAIEHFVEIRDLDLKKKPATAELLAWIQILQSLEADMDNLKSGQDDKLSLTYSILAKTREDLALLKKKFVKNGRD